MGKTESKYTDYKDHFLGEKPLELSKKDRFFINSYLYEVKKRSDFAYRNHKCILKNLLENVHKPVLKINKLDIRNYFNDVLDVKKWINHDGKERHIKLKTKEAYRAYLTSFFNHVDSLLLKKNKSYQNPVPNKNVYKFTKRDIDTSNKSDRDKKLLSKEKILLILNYVRKNMKMKHFIAYGLMICTGARCLEILTIKLKDIKLNERYFETGQVKNARKSTIHTGESLMFFYPENFRVYLKNYILSLKENEEWLFPSTYKKGSHVWISYVDYHKKNIIQKLGFKFHAHMFRHSMITHLKNNGCLLDYREGLLNHCPSSIQGKFYEHPEIPEKRAIYDKFFPYKDFPYF